MYVANLDGLTLVDVHNVQLSWWPTINQRRWPESDYLDNVLFTYSPNAMPISYLLNCEPFSSCCSFCCMYRVVEVVGQVELGELSCDSLADAPDSTVLRFAISSTEVRGEDQKRYFGPRVVWSTLT